MHTTVAEASRPTQAGQHKQANTNRMTQAGQVSAVYLDKIKVVFIKMI